MNKNNDPAFPVVETGPCGDLLVCSDAGLTKRELIAAMAMQGLLTTPNPTGPGLLASYAVNYADALLVQLAKESV